MPRLTAPVLAVAGRSSVVLTPEVGAVVNQAVNLARRWGHAQVSTLHVAKVLLQHPAPSTALLHIACIRSAASPSPQLQCKALELCFNVALNRVSPVSGWPLYGWDVYCRRFFSDALHTALERMQWHHRGSVDTQQQPMLTGKIELKQLVISILDDPTVSRVMRDAGFLSAQVQANVEQAVSDIEANNPASTPTISSTYGPVF